MRQPSSYSPAARKPLNGHTKRKHTSMCIPRRPTWTYKCERIQSCLLRTCMSSSNLPDSQNEQFLSQLPPTAALALSHEKRLCVDSTGNFLIDAQFPIPPAVALLQYKDFLSDFEKTEILDYTHIYFLGVQATKPSVFVDNEGFYAGSIADHIAYRYEITEEINRGAFGIVLRCFDHRSQEMVAIKILKNTDECRELGAHEAMIFENLRSHSRYDKHIVRLHSTFTFRGHYCFAMEALNFNLLESVEMKRFNSMPQLRKIATQILLGLKFLHGNGLVHADLKPENIMFECKEKISVKLIDFGTSAITGCNEFSYVQSRHYRAPEVTLGLKYGQSIDMWSLGCILYEMHTGLLLFPARNEEELIGMICKILGAPPLSLVENNSRAQSISKQYSIRAQALSPRRAYSLQNLVGRNDKLFLEFLEALLRWDPSARMTAEEALEHPWIKCAEKKATVFKYSSSPVWRKL